MNNDRTAFHPKADKSPTSWGEEKGMSCADLGIKSRIKDSNRCSLKRRKQPPKEMRHRVQQMPSYDAEETHHPLGNSNHPGGQGRRKSLKLTTLAF